MYRIITDSSSNLFSSEQEGVVISVIPLTILDPDGGEIPAVSEDMEGLIRQIYAGMRNRKVYRTSMINAQQYIDHFEPVLQAGEDILYVGMSGGISGTCAAAETAAEEVKKSYPDRKILVVDTLSAGLGEGMIVRRACEMKRQGMSLEENYRILMEERMRLCQLFTVDDLTFLSRGGRLSNLGAVIGTLGHIKPILFGNDEGRIVSLFMMVGRKKAIQAMAELYCRTAADPVNGKLCISHGDCEEDAGYLTQRLMDRLPGIAQPECVIHEPGTGIHVGPGMLSMFYFASDDSFRKKRLPFDHDLKGWLQSRLVRPGQ